MEEEKDIGFLLRMLGDMDLAETHDCRRELLEHVLLCSPVPNIRDAANIGLSLMDDPKSIPVFKKAIKKEKSVLLSKVLKKTLCQLEG